MLTNQNRRLSRIGLALAASLGLGVVGTASTAMADPDSDYEATYDKDNDGKLDASERDAMYHDRDQDGRLDRDERSELREDRWERNDRDNDYVYRGDHYRRSNVPMRFRSERAGRIFVQFDRNRNGRLSRWELGRSWLGRRFDRIDRNDDRQIGPRELDRFMMRRDRQASRPRSYSRRARWQVNVDL